MHWSIKNLWTGPLLKLISHQSTVDSTQLNSVASMDAGVFHLIGLTFDTFIHLYC